MPASTRKPTRTGNREGTTACYVYGVVPADVELGADLTGVGEDGGRVSLVRRGDVAALVSEVDVDRPLGRPEDLVAHERILDAVAAGAPVLPFRFGAVMTGTGEVGDELLDAH